MRFIIPILLLLTFSRPALAEGPAVPTADSSDIKLDINTALSVFKELDGNDNYTDNLTEQSLTKLPVGEKRTLNNVSYTVGITQVKFYPQYAEFTAFLRIKIPQGTSGTTKDLFFGAHGIKLTYKGGIIGDAMLGLLGDVDIDLGGKKAILTLKGAFDKNNNMINGGVPVTYASIDCNGFKELSINADVTFSRDILLPDSSGTPGAGQVKASFSTKASDWNDILVNISLPAFQVTGLSDFSFKVGRAIFDFSDVRNDDNTQFPAKYSEQYLLPGSPQLWRGVYISDMVVTLPKLFNRGDSTKRLTLEGKNMLIDDQGFTGIVSGENLITLDEGKAGSWPISIDKFTLDIMAGKLQGAGFGGNIKLPVDDKTKLKYDALISPGNEYLLTVKPTDTLSFGLFRADDVKLYPNSSISLDVKDGKFLPKAILHGKMTINASLKKDAPTSDSGLAKMPAIEFRGLQLQTVSPKITIESMGYDGVIKFGNFPASINKIEVAASNDEARLSFGISVQLMGDGLKGDAGLSVIGKLANNKGLESWKYDRIKLDSLGINFNKGGVIINGHIYVFEDDPTYGKGFAGDISMTLEKLSLKVSAKAVFGRMSNPDYRYWYADAYANLGAAGIPIFAGLKINGLGGGAYERMKLAGKATAKSGIGVTPSGYLYVPDATTSFGLKAIVGFASQDGKAVNGHLTLEMAFSTSGGLRYIHFDGSAKFAKDLPVDQFKQLGDKMERLQKTAEAGKADYAADQKKEASEAAITANAALDLDFENSSLHGVFEVYLNAGVLKGAGTDNMAGQVVMHYEPGSWYIYMGKPDNRIGVKFGIGAMSLQVGAYLMVGSEVPGSPPPPQVVADILGVELSELDYMRDLNALGNGSGFAFGANISLNTGDLTFLIFYAKFEAGLGFDMMLKDYGEAQCKDGDGPIGINGWYANGQAYAYFQGDIGLTFKMFKKEKKVNILKIGAAVLLQAKLPNPAWFRGYVGGYYSVLGGMIKGKCNFKVTIGKECELVNGNPLGDIQVIADLTPKEGTADVDVFAAPQAAFNMAVGRELEMQDDEGNTIRYRISLDKFALTNNGANVPGSLQWNSDRNGVAFYSSEVLPSKVTVKAAVTVSFEEYKGGTWRTVMTNGERTVETKEISFVTGEAPESIPNSNIQYAYPVLDQAHYYPGETKSSYVQLKRGQSYLFDKTTGWKQALRIKDAGGTAQTPAWNYDTTAKRITWTMPTLNNKQQYTFEIVNLPPAAAGTSQQVAESYTATTGDDGNSTEVRNNAVSGTLTNSGAEEKVILTYGYTTSAYNTFAAKINASSVTQVIREPIYSPDVHALQVFTAPTEIFDAQELTGSAYTDNVPMVKGIAQFDNDAYFKNTINPMIYSRYPYNGWVTLPRDSGQSIVPEWAIYPVESYLLYPDNSRLPFRYHLPKQYKTDLVTIQKQLAEKAIYTKLPDDYQTLINTMFIRMQQGNYKMKLIYVLPGGTTGSSAVVDMYNSTL